MKLFKLSLRPGATDSSRGQSVFEGPFIIAAEDETNARDLVTLNCNSVDAVVPGDTLSVFLWQDRDASDCVAIDEISEADIRQCHIVNGTDVASWYLDAMQLSDGHYELAHMVWWPVRPNEECPV